MKKRSRKKKSYKNKKLIHDLEEFTHEWERLIINKYAAEDSRFLQKMANNIKALEQDAKNLEKREGMEVLSLFLHNLLETPLENSESLAEMAIDFEKESASTSELHNLAEKLSEYGSVDNVLFYPYGTPKITKK